MAEQRAAAVVVMVVVRGCVCGGGAAVLYMHMPTCRMASYVWVRVSMGVFFRNVSRTCTRAAGRGRMCLSLLCHNKVVRGVATRA